ncbi:alpha-N-arabinofuranosidase [Prevotella herbatica]|uniref:non-reducing end alpha-L-arabinofuranosidase n=2 Tax=Prevotella herbatica TaxID=2801997 RepID=A0ABM7NZG4_9BACT|nr:alpha-N-arabinofuranosidase [Prevotella herbatica]
MMAMQSSAQVNINVDVYNKGVVMSPNLYGIFYEDINHAADGGLYAELVRNRSFEDSNTEAVAWNSVGGATMKLVKTGLLNKAQAQALEVGFAGNGKASGINNDGYWGINAVQGRTYKLSFWAKGNLDGKLNVCLGNDKKVVAVTEISDIVTGNWKKYNAEFTCQENQPNSRLWITSEGKGNVVFDVVSLFPPTFNNRENGLRPDLASMLLALHPKFLRFPGGCFVEGQESSENAFHWERTIGPIEERNGHKNVNWGYRTSDGLGFHEYLQMAEDFGAKPLYVVNVGIWHGGFTPLKKIQPWIDEALNALEYANGPVTSKYGALRAKNGHPEPFNIEYLEIGNENNQPEQKNLSDKYYERFKLFKKAILAKYPKMHLIGDVAAWGTDDPRWNNPEKVELVDEHYYRSPAWFARNFNKYDSYPRDGQGIYVGEYAVTQGFGVNGSLDAALGEAIYMMGMEKNSDVVKMASYAPIFANLNDLKWRPDMIQFNSSNVFGTPSYYVQKVMADNVGTRVLNVTMNDPYTKNLMARTVAPEVSKFGFATWGTKASFSFDSFSSENASQISVDAAKPMLEIKGDWKSDGNIVSQTSDKEGCIDIVNADIKSNQYTVKAKARKDGGAEGFILVFNYVDKDNYSWINFGGWGNTQHGLEQVVNGSKMQLATKHGSVKTGKWYDITLKQNGDSIKCWLDNELVFDTKLQQNTALGVFSTASYDEKTGDVIVKVVNTTAEANQTNINLGNYNAKSAKLISLSSLKGTNENSIDNPTNVYPMERSLSPADGIVSLEIPAYSLSIVRIK